MPNGNVGTPTAVFLRLIQQCKLPGRVIRTLNLEFAKSRSKRRYGAVGLDYGSEEMVEGASDREEREEEEEEEQNVGEKERGTEESDDRDKTDEDDEPIPSVYTTIANYYRVFFGNSLTFEFRLTCTG